MAIVSGDLSVSGFQQIDEILEMEVTEQPSQHPKARFRASLVEGVDLEKIRAQDQDRIVRMTGYDQAAGRQIILFSGYIDELRILDMGADYYELEVLLIGASCKLDQDKKNRSFQDVSMTHEEVIKKAGSTTPGTSIKWNGDSAQPIEMPVIQYVETDWEFIKRMASIYQKSIFSDATADYPVLSAGMELSDSLVELDSHFYKVGVSKRFYELGGKKAGLIKSNFQYFQITSRQFAGIGQYVTFQGKKLAVCEKKTRLTESEMKYTYRISSPDYGSTRTIYNGTFIGHTILGKVIETQGETVKLDLELDDDEHNDSIAYPYNWTPETGNMMYCMPQAGTKVSLYFSDEEESSGTVVNCIRTNGDSSAKMGNPSNKHFTSEDGLIMDLDLDNLNLTTPEDKEGNVFSRCCIHDLLGPLFETKGNLTIRAGGSVRIKGNYVFIGAANGELSLAGSLQSSQATFYFHYQFDGLGLISAMKGTEFESYPIIQDAPQAGTLPEEKKSGGLWKKVLAGMAGVVLATAAVCLVCTGVGAGAGVIVGVAAAGLISGGFAVGNMALEEKNSGVEKPIQDYFFNGMVQGFFGAASAAVGGGLGSTAAKFALEMATTTASTVTDNLFNGKSWNDGLGLSLFISTVTFGLFDTKAFKNVPVLKHLSSASDYMDDVSGQVDNLGRNATQAATEASSAKAAEEATSEAAEQAVREEAEKAAQVEVARHAERVAQQTRNAVRNSNSATNAAKAAARDAYTAAKSARRSAVEALTSSTAAKNAAEQAATTAAEAATQKAATQAAAQAAKNAGQGSYFAKSLFYNFAKSEMSKGMQDGTSAAQEQYLPQAMDYIESMFSGTEVWAEE